MAESALDALADHRSSDGLADDEPDPGRLGLVPLVAVLPGNEQDDGESVSTGSAPLAHGEVEVGTAPHSVARGQHRIGTPPDTASGPAAEAGRPVR